MSPAPPPSGSGSALDPQRHLTEAAEQEVLSQRHLYFWFRQIRFFSSDQLLPVWMVMSLLEAEQKMSEKYQSRNAAGPGTRTFVDDFGFKPPPTPTA